jgi:hypothetical protein
VREVRPAQRDYQLSRPIGTEVRVNKHIPWSDRGFTTLESYRWNDKLVTLTARISLLNRITRALCAQSIRSSDRRNGEFGSLPALIAIHCKVATRDRSDLRLWGEANETRF